MPASLARTSLPLDPVEVGRSYGFRFVVRDIGNDVDRVLGAGFVPIGDVSALAATHNAVQMFPIPCRFLDASYEAAAALGVIRDGMTPHVEAWARYIDDRSVEVFLRRVTCV